VPEPQYAPGVKTAALIASYLDHQRAEIIDRVLALDDAERRRTRLPSAWSPLELLSHCAHVEQRWIVWGFLGEEVEQPWGDWARDEGEERWQVADDVSPEQLAAWWQELGRRTTELLGTRPLDERGQPGERWDGDPPPDLAWICFHLLDEYARHAGHLDIAVELAAGADPAARG